MNAMIQVSMQHPLCRTKTQPTSLELAIDESAPAADDAFTVAYNRKHSEFSLAQLVWEEKIQKIPEIARPRVFAMLLSLRPEVARLALLTAISASAANALAKGVNGATVRPLTRFFPTCSSQFTLASSRYRRLEPDSEVSITLEKFHADLAAGAAGTLSFFDANDDSNRLNPDNPESIVARWRRACGSALRILTAIEMALLEFAVRASADEDTELLSALGIAQMGGTPFVTESGESAMPEWADVRRNKRAHVDCRGLAMLHGETFDVRICDISTGGAGIETPAELTEGDPISLVLDRSVVLSGRLVWVQGKRAGVAFDRPLVDDAPAYRFLTATPPEA